MSQAQVSSAKLMLTLGLAGLISGGVIASVYVVTAPQIERNRAEALERAIYEVLPNAVANRPYVLQAGTLSAFDTSAGGIPKQEAVYAGFDSEGSFVGFAIPAEGAGFQDTIKLIFGFDPRIDKVIGMRVLESRETPGLGDKIIKDQRFVGQFDSLAVAPPIVATKKGATAEHEIDAISGATISSKAVVNIINASNAKWGPHLPDTAQKPSAGGN